MLEHLDNVIEDIQKIKKNIYNLENTDIYELEKIIIEIKESLKKAIDLKKVKMVSEMIYQLNIDNTFSELTDHISNEFYAFEFLLEQSIKEGKI